MRNNHAHIWLVLAMCVCTIGIGPSSAAAYFVVEDFEAVNPADPGGPLIGGFDDTYFIHRLGLDEYGEETSFLAGFDEGSSVSPRHSLSLTPATDYITFRLGDGEYVTGAEVWMRTAVAGAPTFFHVIGVDAGGRPLEHTVRTPGDDALNNWEHVSTHGVPFAEILEIRLTGYVKGQFDDLQINVVPEPATVGMLGIGFFGLAWSRRWRRP